MRPVDKGNAPNTYQVPANFNFGQSGQATQNAITATLPNANLNPTVLECLNLWLDQVKNVLPPAHGTVQERTAAVTAIQAKVTAQYKLAGVPLTQHLGDFCCYCGSPLSGLLEVEHIAPKSLYPNFSVSWENFLLACGACNTQKGNNPVRATVQGWLPAPPPNPTEQQYYDAIRQHYFWPDIDASVYRAMPPVLQALNPQGQWELVPPDIALNLNNQLTAVDIANRQVFANLVTPQGVQNFQVQVLISPTSQLIQHSIDTIDLLGLNELGNPVGTYDRRVLNRTKAWFTCLLAVIRLENAANQAEFNILWPLVMATAGATGFYSVWAEIFSNFIDFNQVYYVKTFANDTAGNNLYFPNTNIAQVP